MNSKARSLCYTLLNKAGEEGRVDLELKKKKTGFTDLSTTLKLLVKCVQR